MAPTVKHPAPKLPCRRHDVPFKEFGPAEGMLLDLDSGEYYGLEGAALAIWRQLDGRTTVEEICQNLTGLPEAETERVGREVASFVRKLRTAGLLAEPGAVETASNAAGAGGKRRRAGSAKAGYLTPRLTKRGNLKFLGQLD